MDLTDYSGVHKRQGTFDNVPVWQGTDDMSQFVGYAEETGSEVMIMDDSGNHSKSQLAHRKIESWFSNFDGYNAQDTNYLAQIEELNKIIQEKDKQIETLSNEKRLLREEVETLNKTIETQNSATDQDEERARTAPIMNVESSFRINIQSSVESWVDGTDDNIDHDFHSRRRTNPMLSTRHKPSSSNLANVMQSNELQADLQQRQSSKGHLLMVDGDPSNRTVGFVSDVNNLDAAATTPTSNIEVVDDPDENGDVIVDETVGNDVDTSFLTHITQKSQKLYDMDLDEIDIISAENETNMFDLDYDEMREAIQQKMQTIMNLNQEIDKLRGIIIQLSRLKRNS